jgi:ParB-like chromosome segregation protein Spo0J
MPPRTKGKAAVEKANKTLERLTIEYVPIASIHPNSYNPNRQSEHEYELLRKSVEEDGFTQPVLVAEDGETIVDGEHRWRVMQDLGHAEIPIVKVPMGVAQAKIATLRHNRARGSEDIELATDVLRDLERLGALDWAADSLDMSDAELQRLLEDIPAPEALAGDTFGEAWTPATNAEQPGFTGEVAPGTYADSTAEGTAAARDRQQRLADARDETEREAILRDRQVYRMSLTFSGEEAELVKAQMGSRPAARILEWCQRAARETVP